MFHPKKLLTILGLSTLMLSPAMPSFHLTGADTAFAAKGGNGNGNSGGNGGGNAGNHGGGNAKSSEAKAASTDAEAPEETETASNGGAGGLGNMNGALHASPKAILAHIRNGNTNGPVGRTAAYVVASANAEGIDAKALAQQQADYAAWQDGIAAALETSGYADLAAYRAAKYTNTALAAQYVIDKTAYDQGVADGTIDPTVVAAPEPVPAFVTVAELEVPAPPQPSQEDIDALAALSDAETAILSKWNKNPDADPATISAEEQALLDSLLARFKPEDLSAFAAAGN
ncbi:hypothetical protein HYN69_17540 [Gemmobacter aquarius]|uniref:YfdX protein n=1 Tax=Paragemmobacter aquarius TaxID=2169400 RepID=A0A2S0UQJ6_9RHOB|nr:hypothetical protein [Gemmobacter aquarius]AWB50067.1 hypothetical protein HYN69_17540 [Gemmobacter aquarius]